MFGCMQWHGGLEWTPSVIDTPQQDPLLKCWFDGTIKLSCLNEALIPFKNELTFSTTLLATAGSARPWWWRASSGIFGPSFGDQSLPFPRLRAITILAFVWWAGGAAETAAELFAAITLVGLGADDVVLIVIGNTCVAVAVAGADTGAGARIERFGRCFCRGPLFSRSHWSLNPVHI